MRLKEGDGIACDGCKQSHRRDFVYWSFDLRKVLISRNQGPSRASIYLLPIAKSFDFCSSCYTLLQAKILKHYSPRRVGMVCEFTGELLAGTYVYYHGNFDAVTVRSTGTAIDTVVSERELETAISEKAYQGLLNNEPI